MSRITLLRAPGKLLAKRYFVGRDGNVAKVPYDRAAEFLTEVRTFADLDGLAALLAEVERRSDTCAIRGVPGRWHPGPTRPVFRLLRPRREFAGILGQRVKQEPSAAKQAQQHRLVEAGALFPVTFLPMFEEQAADWVLLDFDGVPAPGGSDWREDLTSTADHLRSLLPAAFHRARCWFQATGSAADPTKPDLGGDEIRMRLAFVLARGVTASELKRWLGGTAGLDPATFRPVQITYVARPLFADGLADPMRQRSGVLEGREERVAVPAELAAAFPALAAERPAGGVGSMVVDAAGLGLRPSPKLDRALER
jgi:hypothetical protein